MSDAHQGICTNNAPYRPSCSCGWTGLPQATPFLGAVAANNHANAANRVALRCETELGWPLDDARFLYPDAVMRIAMDEARVQDAKGAAS